MVLEAQSVFWLADKKSQISTNQQLRLGLKENYCAELNTFPLFLEATEVEMEDEEARHSELDVPAISAVQVDSADQAPETIAGNWHL